MNEFITTSSLMKNPSYREDHISQIPALHLLINMGYTYLSPEQALQLRGGKPKNIILEDVLDKKLRQLNHIHFKGQTYDFSDSNIRQAIEKLTNPDYDGLITTNSRLYELLTLGESFKQTIHGDTKSFSLHYIDWKNPANNVYHVTEEFPVERSRSHDTRRPDIVLFVNGIPLVVIECKRPDLNKAGKAVDEAITQMIRNQKDDEIPGLFIYSQLVMAIATNEAMYATTSTAKKFWSIWKEETDLDPEIQALINQPARSDEFIHRLKETHVKLVPNRLPTEQDRLLYALLRPARLLHLIYQFIVYDAGVKKIARYQQFFAIEATVRRVAHLNNQGQRTGGIIWHTTGSGKSLTMVMLAKALALHPNIANPRIILVTDRVDLDLQIYGTFKACGKKVERAEYGADPNEGKKDRPTDKVSRRTEKSLVHMVRKGTADIITTVINKFDAAARSKVVDDNPNVFVLVDESHRSQYGEIHTKMRRVFKKACYIGFTGTPLLKKEKTTAAKFGSFIHKYTMRQAVEDNAVVPLLYEGRMADLQVDQAQIDKWFERVTRGLTAEQKLDLKRQFSRNEEIDQADQRIKMIAYDISEHYDTNWKNTGFKAQLAASSKRMALKYKSYLDEFGLVTSEVVISPPDTREGNEAVDNTIDPEMERFWKRMMARFKSEDAYNREIRAAFADPDGLDILIVVDKLLTGFDEPRNTVLYIDKPLKEHSLLQAIARVNRLFDKKEFGYIIDYKGVLGELNQAMQTYDALEGFDPEDVAGTVTDASEEVAKLPQYHTDLWDVFKTVSNKEDIEALERFLEPEDIRQKFYDALNRFAKCLRVALATVNFYEQTPEWRINTYKADLRFFHNLRVSVKRRYAEAVEYKDYEHKIRKLMDSHIKADDVVVLAQPVNIFNDAEFEQVLEEIEGTVAKADTIAHTLKRTISEKWEQDPEFYKKLSRLIEETIEAYRRGRIDELEYLKKMTEAREALVTGRQNERPERLGHYQHAGAYYGILKDPLTNVYTAETKTEEKLSEFEVILVDMAIKMEQIIEERKIVDWIHNPDIQNKMLIELEDYLYSIKGRYDLHISGDEIDAMLSQVIEVAKQRGSL